MTKYSLRIRFCLPAQIIGRIIELNDVADRGQPINASAMMHDSSDEMEDVFAVPLHKQQQQQQQQHLIHTSARLNTTDAPANTSFDFRPTAAPPVQVRETTM